MGDFMLDEEAQTRAEFWKEHWQGIQPGDYLVAAETHTSWLTRGQEVRVDSTNEDYVYLDTALKAGFLWHRFEPHIIPMRIIGNFFEEFQCELVNYTPNDDVILRSWFFRFANSWGAMVYHESLSTDPLDEDSLYDITVYWLDSRHSFPTLIQANQDTISDALHLISRQPPALVDDGLSARLMALGRSL